MATLIEIRTAAGVIGRCDAKCYDGAHDKCDCICGGANHGVGVNRAIQQTAAHAKQWVEEYRQAHPGLAEQLDFGVLESPAQMEFLPGMSVGGKRPGRPRKKQ